LLSDNFEREELGSDWTIIRNTWTIETGELNAEGVDGLLSSGQYFTNASIEVKVKIIDDGGNPTEWMGFIARAANPNDDCWTSGYLVYLRNNGSIELYTYVDNVIAAEQTDATPDDFVTISAYFNGSNIQVFVNGVLYIDVEDNRYSAGYFSLKNQVAHGHFDDVLVENPPVIPNFNVVPEPAPIIISLLILAAFASYGLIKHKKQSIRSPLT